MIVIMVFADPHFTDRPFRGRRDEYLTTQVRKLDWLIQLCHQIQVDAVLCPGDLFDDPKGSRIQRWLDSTLTPRFRQLPDLYHIRGNHDMLHDRPDSLDHHPLGMLEMTETLHHVEEGWTQHLGGNPSVRVCGKDFCRQGPRSWLQSIRTRDHDDGGSSPRRQSGYRIALTHCFWGDRDGEIYGEPVLGMETLIGTGIDVMVHGHDHRFFGHRTVSDPYHQKTIHVVGPGALTRQYASPEELVRKPQVAILRLGDTVEVEFVEVPHAPAAQVFDLAVAPRKRTSDRHHQEFGEALKQFPVASLPSFAAVLAEIQAECDRGTQTAIDDLLQQADREIQSPPVLPSRGAEEPETPPRVFLDEDDHEG